LMFGSGHSRNQEQNAATVGNREKSGGSTPRVVDRDGGSRPIDEQLHAGFVLVAQPHILFAAPALEQLAEARVAIAVRVGLTVLLPEQLLGHVWMHLPLRVKLGEVWHRQCGGASPWWT